MRRKWMERVGLAAVGAVLATTLGFGVAWGNHIFDDVPDGSFFGPAINAGAGAGCFNGYPDGEFKGGRNATREQFAYWLNNCAGRVANVQAENANIDIGTADFEVQDVHITVGGNGSQFVHLTAAVSVVRNDPYATACSSNFCGVQFALYRNGTRVSPKFAFRAQTGPDKDLDVVAITTVVKVPSGAQTFDLIAEPFGNVANELSIGRYSISAMTAPFGSTGAGTLEGGASTGSGPDLDTGAGG